MGAGWQLNFYSILINIFVASIALNKFSFAISAALIILLVGIFTNKFIDYKKLFLALFYVIFLIWFALLFSNSNGINLLLIPILASAFIVFVMFIIDFRKVDSYALAFLIMNIYVVGVLWEIRVWETLLSRPENIKKVWQNFNISINRLVVGYGLITLIAIHTCDRFAKTQYIALAMNLLLLISFLSRVSIIISCWTVICSIKSSFKKAALAISFLLSGVLLFNQYSSVFFHTVYWRISNIILLNDNRFKSYDDYSECIKTTIDFLLGNASCVANSNSDKVLDNFFSLLFLSGGLLSVIFSLVLFALTLYLLRGRSMHLLISFVWMFLVFNIDESIGKVEFMNPILLILILLTQQNSSPNNGRSANN